jgi:endonuclease/exonuclease/phosphatase family metal-dependent hydrolase
MEKPVDIKVISYNIRLSTKSDGDNWWENRKQASINMINEEKPTIFGLQEALPVQVEYLAENLPEYAYIGVGRDDGKQKGEFMAIFYRKDEVELLDGGTFWLSETPEKPSRGWDAACFRSCTWTKLKMKSNGKIFAYLNTHLDHVGKEARKEGLALIAKRAQEIVSDDMPVFLTADFNAVTSNPIFEPVKAIMKDAREVAPETDRRATINFYQPGNEDKADWIIDHIFFRGATPKTFKVLRDKDYGAPYISDHYPVVLEAEI